MSDNSPSGKAPVTGSLTSAVPGGEFYPVAGEDFNATCALGGAVAVVRLERKFTWSTTWFVVISDTMRQSLPESFTITEPEYGVAYRWNCTAYTSGTVVHGLSA